MSFVQASAFALPFSDGTFDVVVADPPYAGHNRGKLGVDLATSGYIPFVSYDWWGEAMRVLKPSGHLYVVCAMRELPAWLAAPRPEPVDIIAWVAPNAPSMAAYWRRGTGGRAPGWRPIIHWQREPFVAIAWPDAPAMTEWGRKRKKGKPGKFVDPNYKLTSIVTSQMRQAEPWPNQLPLDLLRWLLRPHVAVSVLDLFSGSGTTRVVCDELGLRCVSVDLAPEALAINRGRAGQMALRTE